MTAMLTLPVPPAFDAAMWEDHSDADAGPNYRGVQFTFEEVNQFIKADDTDLSWLVVCGQQLPVGNLQLETDADQNYPIYFEVSGRRNHYVVSMWQDRVSIQVCGDEADGYEVRSTMFPATIRQLEQALTAVVDDCRRFMELPHELMADG